MFKGGTEQVMLHLEEMPVRGFLERLLTDDTVNEIVSSGTILVIEWTNAVKSPCGLIGFGIVRNVQSSRNIYFAVASDRDNHNSHRRFLPNLSNYFCERKKYAISVEELIEWIKPLNVPSVAVWTLHIMEAKEHLAKNPRGSYLLPMRFSYLANTISSAIS
ncbi:MAG: hypothetical protein WC663_05910 [Patescibacteria group bacterium]